MLRHTNALPCPFCGGISLAAVVKASGDAGLVQCKGCGATGPRVFATASETEEQLEERLWASTEAAILAWSFRAPDEGQRSPRDIH